MRIDPFVIKIRSQSQNVVQHLADKSTTVHVHFKVKLRQTVWFNMRFVWCDDLYWNDANKGNDDNDVKYLNILIFSKLLNILFIRHRIILKLGDIIWLTGVRGRTCVCVCMRSFLMSFTDESNENAFGVCRIQIRIASFSFHHRHRCWSCMALVLKSNEQEHESSLASNLWHCEY